MLRKLLALMQAGILARPGIVLTVSILLAVAAVLLGMRVELRTSRSELAPTDEPDQIRYDRLLEDIGDPDALIAAVEAAPGATKSATEFRAFTDELAAELGGSVLVSHVFWKIDLAWFVERGLWLLPPGDLAAAVEAARAEMPPPGTLESVRTVADLNDLIAGRIEDSMTGTDVPEGAAGGASRLAELIGAEKRFLESPAETTASLEGDSPLLALVSTRPELASGGYITTHDGSTFFLLVFRNETRDDSLPALQGFLEEMRRRAETVAARHGGFRVGFAGQAALTVDEMAGVRRDTRKTGLISAIGVAVLTFLCFRWRTHALLVLAALAIGLAWSLAAVYLLLGYLNMITSSFLTTLIGLGVAYGIHPVSEYELEGAHTSDPERNVRETYHRTGTAVTVAAITTSAGFFSIMLMNFRGFSEMGLVSGFGILLCLASMLIALPALLVVYGKWRHGRDRRLRDRAATAVVDRLWVEHGSRFVCRWPKTTLLAALAVTAFLGWHARKVGFDTNILSLLPANAESLRYQERMIMDSSLSPSFNLVTARDLDSLRALEARAKERPEIARFESVLQFLPADRDASAEAIADLGEWLAGIELPSSTAPLDRGELARSLRRLEEALSLASDQAFGGGLGDLAAALEEARSAAEETRLTVETAPEGAEEGWDGGQARLLAIARRGLDELRSATTAAAPTIEDLPEAIRRRFVTSSGLLLGYMHPAGNAFDPEVLEPFVAASRNVSAEAAGFPIVFSVMSHRITSGFDLAVTVGAVLMFLTLLADYRSFRDSLLASVPLGIGVVWMLGAMHLLGISYNFANMVGVPLILGVGIDNGVHIVHRFRLEGREGMTVVLRHTGRAILIATLTTIVGFGSLSLASHRGLASLGSVLILGTGACLLSSTIVLPNLLVALGLAKR